MQSQFRNGYIIAVIACLFSCSGAPKQTEQNGTPYNQYTIGMQKIETGDLAAAEAAFDRATELDNRSAEGHTGKAFLELARNNHSQAIKHANRALSRDPAFYDAAAAKALAITLRAKGDDWLDEALETLDEALTIDPPNEYCLFALGHAYLMAADYSQAQITFEKLIARAGTLQKKAQAEAALAVKLEKAGVLSVRARDIALTKSVTRADFCVLLNDRLHVIDHLDSYRPQLYEILFDKDGDRRHSPDVYSEVSGNRWRNDILDIVILRLPSFGLYTDGRFRPDRLVNRADVASAIQDVLVLLHHDLTIATRYIGTDSPVIDVHADSYAYNAIRLCLEEGYLSLQSADAFHPDEIPEAIEVVLALAAVDRVLSE